MLEVYCVMVAVTCIIYTLYFDETSIGELEPFVVGILWPVTLVAMGIIVFRDVMRKANK